MVLRPKASGNWNSCPLQKSTISTPQSSNPSPPSFVIQDSLFNVRHSSARRGTLGNGQRAGNREQGTGNVEHRTSNREQGTGNIEQGTSNREQGTGNRGRAVPFRLDFILPDCYSGQFSPSPRIPLNALSVFHLTD